MKFIKSSLLLAGLTFFSISCSDYLKEEGYRADYSYYKTTPGLEALVISCYQQTRFACSYENQYGLEDLGTDLYMVSGDGGYRDAFGQFLSSAMTPQQSLLSNFWTNNYKGISSCNLGIQMLEADTEMAADVKAIRMGEILFLRAYYYYELVIQFGDIPLVLEVADYPKTDYVRVPQKQVWAQIIADARKAWELLPWADAAGKIKGEWGRAGKGAAGHLLAKAYMFRYSDKYAKTQTDPKMAEDRGGLTTDIDSVIYFGNRVCNYGDGAGSGSNHSLAPNFSTLWGWDSKKGLIAEYMGPEIVFSVNYSTTYFYNNVGASDVNSGGNWNHLLYTGQFENYTLTTKLEDGTSASWGSNVGVVRDLITGRPWRRVAPTPYLFAEDGLYGARNYETEKNGRLVDSRLYKSHVWVYYCNSTGVNVPWKSYSNGAGSFNPADIGKVEGEQRYAVGDTAIFLSLEDVTKRFANGTPNEKLALARAQEKYWYFPYPNIKVPKTRGEVSGYDVITNQFPTPTKYLDSRRAAVGDQGGYRNFMRMRLAETYILLSEAYARKGDFAKAAETLNFVRLRAAWKDGEEKSAHFWKCDGGSYENRKVSTENDMKVTAGFLNSFSGDKLTDFYLDEMGHETAGELNRFDLLVRYGADYWYNRVKKYNYWVSNDNGVSNGAIKLFHRFRPIPQSHIDNVIPADPNPQNYGY